jgi:hypothetical protein
MAERFPHAVRVPAALLDFDDVDKQVGGVDQISSYGVNSLTNRELLFSLYSGLVNGTSQLLFVGLKINRRNYYSSNFSIHSNYIS